MKRDMCKNLTQLDTVTLYYHAINKWWDMRLFSAVDQYLFGANWCVFISFWTELYGKKIGQVLNYGT